MCLTKCDLVSLLNEASSFKHTIIFFILQGDDLEISPL